MNRTGLFVWGFHFVVYGLRIWGCMICSSIGFESRFAKADYRLTRFPTRKRIKRIVDCD